MTKITTPDIKGTATTKFIKDFNTAFATGAIPGVLDCFTDDIVWNMIGDEILHGKQAAAELLATMDDKASALIIESIVVDGDRAVANGTLDYPDGSTIGFCDMYTLTNDQVHPKIKTLTSYAIEL